MPVFLSSLIFFDDFAFLHKAVSAEQEAEESLKVLYLLGSHFTQCLSHNVCYHFSRRVVIELPHWAYFLRILAGEGGDFGIGHIHISFTVKLFLSHHLWP